MSETVGLTLSGLGSGYNVATFHLNLGKQDNFCLFIFCFILDTAFTSYTYIYMSYTYQVWRQSDEENWKTDIDSFFYNCLWICGPVWVQAAFIHMKILLINSNLDSKC